MILHTVWPEWSPGLGLGMYFIQTGRYDVTALIGSIPSGILVHNLLLLNEFPDVDADREGGRKTTPVVFGMEATARFFRITTVAVYVWIVGCVLATFITGRVFMPSYCLIALLSLSFAVKTMQGSKAYTDRAAWCRRSAATSSSSSSPRSSGGWAIFWKKSILYPDNKIL